MLLRILHNIINCLLEDREEPTTVVQSSITPTYPNLSGVGLGGKGPYVNSSYSELIKTYPHTYGLFRIYDPPYSNDKDKYTLSKEILNRVSLKEIKDYMFEGDTVFFKDLEDKKRFEEVGQKIRDQAMAAIAFRNLEKSKMGEYSFVEDNTFYISVRPEAQKEKELLKEVTSFYKGHGYNVDSKNFQDNFYSYGDDFDVRFYVNSEATAAELSFYVSSKNLAIIL